MADIKVDYHGIKVFFLTLLLKMNKEELFCKIIKANIKRQNQSQIIIN